jgi:hypothetical protein
MTKPRNLLKIILEEIQRKGWDIINPAFYDDFTVLGQDMKYKPIRGHGLGMAN